MSVIDLSALTPERVRPLLRAEYDRLIQLGYFQYGGSTYCLIFRPGVIENFERQPPYDDGASPVQVNAHLCTAR